MAVYKVSPHLASHSLLPEYRVTFIRSSVGNSLEYMTRSMLLRDEELISRFMRDDDNPDYIFASAKCLCVREDCERLRDYLRRRKDAVFIFLNDECIEPDMNLFDYAFTWNPDLIYGDRIIHNIPAAHDMLSSVNGRDVTFHTNSITREEARKKLEANPGFCNFIYSHPNEPRDSFFLLLSRYKRVDAFGKSMNNITFQPASPAKNWYIESIEIKSGYKFSIAMENASSKGYTTEKIVSSLQAHTVPIYWGDPAVADFINPKAFINCNDYSSFDEVVERVKEIDNDDELWLDSRGRQRNRRTKYSVCLMRTTRSYATFSLRTSRKPGEGL